MSASRAINKITHTITWRPKHNRLRKKLHTAKGEEWRAILPRRRSCTAGLQTACDKSLRILIMPPRKPGSRSQVLAAGAGRCMRRPDGQRRRRRRECRHGRTRRAPAEVSWLVDYTVNNYRLHFKMETNIWSNIKDMNSTPSHEK